MTATRKQEMCGKVNVGMLARTALVLLAAIGGSAGCATPYDPPPVQNAAPLPVDGHGVEAYRIGPGDVLHIAVWKHEALSRTVPVRPDGMISLPLVHDVRAAGLTALQLRDIVRDQLVEYVREPEVSVIVQEVRSLVVSVLGEVRRAGRYEFRNGATVLDMLANAGGVTEFAARPRIVILRPNGAGVKRMLFNYDKAIAAGGEDENMLVQPGDIIVVP